MRQRDTLIKYSSDHIRHMQKALQQMNLKLTTVVSDITGQTGMSIINAILAGERDPLKLAALRNTRCHNDEETIALALHGNWRAEHLFALQQAVELFEFYQQKLAELDVKIQQCLQRFEDKSGGQELERSSKRKKNRPDHREPDFDIRNCLYRMTGVDLTAVDGIGGQTALQIVAEIGTDMSVWETEKHFVSWLCLCPEVNLTGGSRKSKKSKTRQARIRVANTLRISAQSVLNTKSALGAFGRRLRAKKGPAQAIVAVARKLAIIIYNMLKTGRPYVDRGQEVYQQQLRERAVRNLKRQAQNLGFQLHSVA